ECGPDSRARRRQRPALLARRHRGTEVMMRRRSMRQFPLVACALAVLGASVTAAAGAADLPEVKWRLQSSFPRSLDTIHGGAELIARRVSEVTGGKFQISVFAAGEIVPPLQVLDAVQNG